MLPGSLPSPSPPVEVSAASALTCHHLSPAHLCSREGDLCLVHPQLRTGPEVKYSVGAGACCPRRPGGDTLRPCQHPGPTFYPSARAAPSSCVAWPLFMSVLRETKAWPVPWSYVCPFLILLSRSLGANKVYFPRPAPSSSVPTVSLPPRALTASLSLAPGPTIRPLAAQPQKVPGQGGQLSLERKGRGGRVGETRAGCRVEAVESQWWGSRAEHLLVIPADALATAQPFHMRSHAGLGDLNSRGPRLLGKEAALSCVGMGWIQEEG